MLLFNIIAAATLIASGVKAQTYTLNTTYDHTNWYTAWTFEDGPDPTHGLVEYQNLESAQNLSLTKIINNQVFMGVDNHTVIAPGSSTGRNSIWLESKAMYDHYLMIADFEHMPGSDCGTWPGFWSINNEHALGEIDIIEGANTQTHNSMTLHTLDDCTFHPRNETGVTNGVLCGLQQEGPGCDTTGGMYGSSFNNASGGVYATLWNSDAIQIFFWQRDKIPEDVACGEPKPETWGIPLAQFAGDAGGCDIDTNFQSQTIYFDTTFCGANAGGEAWTTWSDCSKTTGYATCEEYVQAHPEAFDDAYWLINYVKVYSETSSTAPPISSSVAPPPASSSSHANPSVSAPPAKSSVVVQSSFSTTVSESTSTSKVASPSATMKVSVSGSCGPGVTCEGSTFGDCCSAKGYCGSNLDYCGTGCQSAFGQCPETPSRSTHSATGGSHLHSTFTTSATLPTSTGMKVSDYGNCGGSVNTTCENSDFGNCCSQWGFCGSSDAYCGDGCQPKFGSCA